MATYRWRLVQTPNPSEFAFAVFVPQETIAKNPTFAPFPGDLFKDLGVENGKSYGWIPDAALAQDDRFGLYVYVQMFVLKDGAEVMFVYGKPKTEEEKNTAFRVTNRRFGNHRWPPILKALGFITDYNFPRSANSIRNNGAASGIVVAPNYYVREAYIPEVNEGTRFREEEFFSPTPFNIPRYPVPQATSVSYDINGVRGRFPECLHPEIVVPPTATASAQMVGGFFFPMSGNLEGQRFPRTNFRTWTSYVLMHTQEQMEGGWYGRRVRVFPPPTPKLIIE